MSENDAATQAQTAADDAEVAIFISSPNDGGVNVKMIPRDESPNQDSPAVILASYLNANMQDIVIDAMTTYKSYKAAIANGETHEQAANAPALELAKVPKRSILTADGNIARTADSRIILPIGS